ncbi:MAG: thiamine pyrophosphate-dependent enzyme, partial [Pseudonocardia sp.]
VEAARAADPIARLRAALLNTEVADEDRLAELEAQARAEADEAVAFAAASPHPDVSTLFDHTYATPVATESRRLPADALFR